MASEAPAPPRITDEERRLRQWARTIKPRMGGEHTALRWAVEEIDRLRRLPVIAACNGCTQLWSEKMCLITARDVDPHHAPPEWCPMRGGE